MAQFHGNQEDFITFKRKSAQKLDEEIFQKKNTRVRSKNQKYIEHPLLSVPPY